MENRFPDFSGKSHLSEEMKQNGKKPAKIKKYFTGLA